MKVFNEANPFKDWKNQARITLTRILLNVTVVTEPSI